MTPRFALSAIVGLLVAGAISPIAFAASQSSNSSSNSSNGVTTRVDTYHATDDRGRRIYRREVYRGRVAKPPRSRHRGWRDDDGD